MVQKWVGKQQLFPTFLSCVLSWKSRKRDLGKTDVFEGGFPAWLQGVLQSAGPPECKETWELVHTKIWQITSLFQSQRETDYAQHLLPVDLYLIFEKSSLTNWIFSLQKSILKLIFAGYTGSKNPVWTWLKIQFVELVFPNWFFRNNVQINRGTRLSPPNILTFRCAFQ